MFRSPYKPQQIEVTFSEDLIPQPARRSMSALWERQQAQCKEMQAKLSPQEYQDWLQDQILIRHQYD